MSAVLAPQVRRGDLVYDPFVGTGSLLVAAAHLGALTLGADIDVRVLRDGKRGGDGRARARGRGGGPAS
jgi:tRNA G10  N-methylase Trm11